MLQKVFDSRSNYFTQNNIFDPNDNLISSFKKKSLKKFGYALKIVTWSPAPSNKRKFSYTNQKQKTKTKKNHTQRDVLSDA